jgi:putative CocE/NonD family hydrolase
VSYEICSLRYQTAPFFDDVEFTGPIAFYFYASIDQDDTNWMVYLSDVDEQGKQEFLARGYLKASHRAIDKKLSKPLEPYHPHTKREPIMPGQIYEYAIGINPISNVFKAGHRLRLEIRTLEHSKEPEGVQPPYSIHIGSSKTVLHNIYRDKVHQSYLLLPIIPK